MERLVLERRTPCGLKQIALSNSGICSGGMFSGILMQIILVDRPRRSELPIQKKHYEGFKAIFRYLTSSHGTKTFKNSNGPYNQA